MATTTQKAIFPIDNLRITAGYKTKGYTDWFFKNYGRRGVIHYGVDMTDRDRKDYTVKAPFDMKIVYSGYDKNMGYTIIASSTKKVNIHNGKFKGNQFMAIRMAHLGKLVVKTGDVVKQGMHIANYGKTGIYGGVYHLHLELSLNHKNPKVGPTIASTHWIKGADTTIHPMDVFKQGPGQTFSATYWTEGMTTDDTITLNHEGEVIKAKKVV